MNKLKEKVVIVIGGVMGIGKVIVICFVEEGVKVVIWDINEEKGKVLVVEFDGLFFKVNIIDFFVCEVVVKVVVDVCG